VRGFDRRCTDSIAFTCPMKGHRDISTTSNGSAMEEMKKGDVQQGKRGREREVVCKIVDGSQPNTRRTRTH
jgi:hypothetical protein